MAVAERTTEKVAEKVAPKYKAVFERTDRRMVEGEKRTLVDSFENPDDPDLKALVNNGKVGYLRITEIATGNKIHGITTSAMMARDLMRSCLSGRYNPFPKIRNKKREVGEV